MLERATIVDVAKPDAHFVDSPYLVDFDGKFRLDASPTNKPDDAIDKAARKARLAELQEEIRDLQARLYAEDRHSLLLVFQAMDAAGKDGTIRAVMTGINPAGCEVHSFKQPTAAELDHDFLWRQQRALPQRGRIGIFNRSHYEEVLVVRVHPEYLLGQRIPSLPDLEDGAGLESLFGERLRSIAEFERHLAAAGTLVVKFWLNVSKREQAKRFLDRIDEPESNWKFSPGDVREREHWDAYMHAYEEALRATSKPWAPWYAIPADSKSYMRLQVAQVIRDTLVGLNLEYPKIDEAARREMLALRPALAAQLE